ncbi:MAG: hypothetical protein ABEI31_07360 [Halodesulfurarchaeum sp.]
MRVREWLGISPRRQAQISRVLTLSLVGFLFVGLYEMDVGVTVNAALGLAVTQLPAVLERDYEIPMDAGLTLWITAAVFLHAFGTVGLPWMEASFYRSVWWWDHLTHAVSSSIVGGAGYATARALDEHIDDLYFPPAFAFALILLLVLAFGVLWEVAEFAVTEVSSFVGAPPALTQYGVGDTMLDLVFDAVGAVIVATWGTAHLTGVVAALQAKLETGG